MIRILKLLSEPIVRQKQINPIMEAIKSMRLAFLGVGLFSLAVNLLMLTGPLFMLQLYDRVLTSRSVSTLVALLVLVIALYGFMGLFDMIRVRVLSRVGYNLDKQLNRETFQKWVSSQSSVRQETYKPLADLSIVQGFIGSNALTALFDFPWFPIYLFVVFLLHVKLGLLAVAGTCIVVFLAFLNQYLSKEPLNDAMKADRLESQFMDRAYGNADSILSMGMLGNVTQTWSQLRENRSHAAQNGGERVEFFTAFSKSFRMLLQSGILAMGGYLAIINEISAGMVVAGSIIAGRALAPLDQIIGNWRNIVRAHGAYKRLKTHLTHAANQTVLATTQLPAPVGHLKIAELVKRGQPSAPGGDAPLILQNLNFELSPGEALGVIGPSASGKSTLARLLVGLWRADRGSVRLDGATFDQWDRDELGQYIGYLPQRVDLMPGTIGQNIARFSQEPDEGAIMAAAKMAGVDQMVKSIPGGFEAQVGTSQSVLSGGQIQRIGLARAVYKTPPLVVLDEPNSNLDAEGDAALNHAIAALKEKGSTVVVMAHRPSAIASVDKILVLKDGLQVEYGPKQDVLKKVTRVAAG